MKPGRTTEHPNGFVSTVRLPTKSGSTFCLCLRSTKVEADTATGKVLSVVKNMGKNLTTPDS